MIIADDESLSRDMLQAQLMEISPNLVQLSIVALCATGRRTIESVEELCPDLLFLDINMPDGDGMAVAKAMYANRARAPRIIFTTAHAEHAAEAFEVEAVDYLLKPIQSDRLKRAIERVLDLQKAGEHAPAPRMIAIPVLGGIEMLDANSIEWIEADGDYVRVHAGTRSFHFRKTLSAFAADFQPLFRQTHRSYLVNLDQVVRLIPKPKGEALLQTRSGGDIPVSRSHRHVIEDLMPE
ncbi:LytTR family DNA-binding domain-containing protein [Hyphomonas sp. BRH_c22]|uniref:LytR/AlgR family response regulator transcription factor n=1 Tax=Hyphomonas sp. BRH_c22 TaxID=1629710 RepID=UPI00262A09A7|nr:LytTR family DNA-binding domain-containing protein [Hyphomonas sp. BRH_c22]